MGAIALLIAGASCHGGDKAGTRGEGPAMPSPFTGELLRLDLFHSGNGKDEIFTVHEAKLGGPWPGRASRLDDDLGLGAYRVEWRDLDGRVLYREGYGSIFGEWATTPEADGTLWRTFPETVRVPAPDRTLELRIEKRDRLGRFEPVFLHVFDPRHPHVLRAAPPASPALVLQEEGPAGGKVDLLLLGDGYRAQDADAFATHARAAMEALFAVEPFRSRRTDFNVRAFAPPAAERGISRPRADVHRDSPLRTSFDALGSDRYVLTFHEHRWRDHAAGIPYDTAILLVPERKYGGGGIYGQFATAAAESSFADYLVVHEFGHSFAGLADEYFTSPVAYATEAAADGPAPIEPWEPNVTADPDASRLKWRGLVRPGLELPTPWPHARFVLLSNEFQARRNELVDLLAPDDRLEALFEEERATLAPLLAATPGPQDVPVADRIGAYEGAAYRARGVYRPAPDCIMFTRDDVGFCAVCRAAIERVIDRECGR